MGTGEFICVSMSGGAPWGFRLQGGREQKQPLRVAKIRSQSKAAGSGLREGDEVVSINGHPCAGLSHPQVVELMESVSDSLHLLVKRAASGVTETLIPETETRTQQRPPQEGHVESTTLQIRPAPPSQDREPCIVPIKSGAPLAEDRERGPAFPGSRKEESSLSCPASPHAPAAPKGHSEEEPVRPGPVLELQLSLSREGHSGTGVPVVALLGAETSQRPDPDPDLDCGEVAHINSVPSSEKGAPPLRSSKIVQIGSSQELPVTRGRGAGAAGLPRVEVIFDCADRQQTEGCRLPAAAGGVDSLGEGGQSEAPPSLVAFAVSSEGTEPGAEPRCGRDHSRPHKHRARHARLRRSESLSEKQAKEAKSRCRSIALLLTAPPSPHSRGVLMFKKLRRRARKFTLVSYGTGELQRQEEAGDPEDGHSDSPLEEALLGASESDGDEELLSDSDHSAHAATFDWGSTLGDAEKKLTGEDKMEMLPDTSGKGALMFARRRERMDQIAAQKEDAVGAGTQADGLGTGASHLQRGAATATQQSYVSGSYIEVSPGPGHAPQHNGFGAAPYTEEAPRMAPTNRTARPFPGSMAQPAAAFTPPRGWTSPTADFPAPPPYSAVTPPPPGALAQAVNSPTAGPAQPPPWPQPAPWVPECIASRDERIAVPAKRTGILQEAKRRGTTKPMFTFKEPKVSPNPELLSLLQNSEGKRGTGAGGDSGPEEDYLSLGAEACNFMQGPSAKQKTPPPVAPKPAVKSSSSQPVTPVTPVSPVWSPGLAPAHPPAFPMASQSQGTIASPIKIAQPSYPPARPASALSPAGPFRGPPAAVASVNYTTNTAKPAAAVPAGSTGHVAAVEPPSELPGMQGRGAQLFAKRQSRMEKYVVDSDTVQAHAARAQSPTPSLPAGWKYSSNIRAPPPVAYNPILSPSYPPAAMKSQPSAPQASKPSKKKGKKPLNALDVMKHQPYQLNASLFTFQPPDAKAGPPQRPSTKINSVPARQQALPPLAVSASSPANRKASSVCSVPARSPQPAFFPEAASPISASPVPGAVPSSPQQEPASAVSLLAPRPKFSARKSGVAAQESGRSLSLPGRPAPPAVSATPPWAHWPACSCPPHPSEGLERPRSGLAPWEAVAQTPLGLAQDAFEPRNIRESIAANVVSAARRKVLPGPSEDWNDRLPRVLQAPGASTGSLGRREYDAAPPFSPRVPPSSQWSYACSRQLSRTGSEMMSLETRSDYGVSVAGGNYNPRPRGWRPQM
ncbi:synaptopodin-2 [Sturnira hondurensis]|uniref:synaptopodin-2 n=1 Tax=Sturnira hondurensis TaxID=192404 RepID=UPI00187A966B|nr:synaptopodin-2 [Sturnira hondurensis]